MDEDDRLEREEARQALREREAVEQAQLLEWKQFERSLVHAINNLMKRAGYHFHRGEWRKVRMEPTDATR